MEDFRWALIFQIAPEQNMGFRRWLLEAHETCMCLKSGHLEKQQASTTPLWTISVEFLQPSPCFMTFNRPYVIASLLRDCGVQICLGCEGHPLSLISNRYFNCMEANICWGKVTLHALRAYPPLPFTLQFPGRNLHFNALCLSILSPELSPPKPAL